ncbi:hypothetical protein E1293_27610 [Actinomadura darangshiensis]|uniref:Ferric oxidoreductase domain-containing protein n=1 Tax=Actinomadura darangshiensis TaxID=705336 RepID=A0A4R5AWJ8_9ACTN|nr:hypothetical protein [Actinomadura darangshiensis]TDD76106.1 hypothetical protein E1293_27610 [Actinomadura darangshiensis]
MGRGRERPATERPAHEGTQAFLIGPGGVSGSRTAARAGRSRPAVPRAAIVSAVCTGAAGVLFAIGVSSGMLLPELRAIGSFLDFYCGVFALVSLSLTVMAGVLATDRAVLSPSHRVRAQAAHRALAFLAVAMLLLHLASQLARHRVGAVQAFLPHSLHHLGDYGLGTLAFYLLVIAFAGGVARGRFAVARRPWVWRALHLTAYAAWPIGVLHGLTSGRAPARWVTAGYLLCLAAVALAAAARPVLARRAGRNR